MFDLGILKSVEFQVPVVCIGNITVGGTGKTPMAEMILDYMSQYGQVALISRGYGRRTKGYIEVQEQSHYRDVGDEPLQLKLKFPEAVVVVCEDRVKGIRRLIEEHPDITCIVMDDGFQHRYVKPKVNIVVIDATRPIEQDKMLPLGNLRDTTNQLYRANYFIVTKCPDNMTPLDRRIMHKVLVEAPYQNIYFTRVERFRPLPVFADGNPAGFGNGTSVIAMSGIGNPRPFVDGLKKNYNVVAELLYKDHHVYRVRDLEQMDTLLAEHPDAYILTTEKDAVKFTTSNKVPPRIRERLYYQPINVAFIDDSSTDFLSKLEKDVRNN